MVDVAGFMASYADIDDPYPFYDEVRAEGPVLWVPDLNRWLVTGYRPASALLRHEHVSSDRRNWSDYQLPPGRDRPPGGMFSMDPPEHTRLRAPVQQAFTPRLIERLRPGIEALTDKLLAAAAERGEIETMTDFACPLPATVVAELLGIPAQDQELFRDWTTTYTAAIDPVSHVMTSDRGVQAEADLTAYLTAVVAERQARPCDDLITALAGAGLAGDELVELCILLVIAGLETTANLIGNGLHALLANPGQLAKLRADPALISTAVEELLRYDPPVQLSGRVPLRDIELDGHTLRAGQMAGILLGAANRDPDAFDEPNRLDLTRSPNHHLALGRGIHYCLGAPLARLVGAVAIGALVSRFPAMRPAGPVTRRANVHVRGFESLPVALR
jgi:cytochrome P450